MSALTLLTLPAEIRQNIYAFIVENIEVDFTIFKRCSIHCRGFEDTESKICNDPAHVKMRYKLRYRYSCEESVRHTKTPELHLACRMLRAEFLPVLGKLTLANVQLHGWYQRGHHPIKIKIEPGNLPTELWRASVRQVTLSLGSLKDATTLNWDHLLPCMERLTLNIRDCRYNRAWEYINVPLNAQYISNTLVARLGINELESYADQCKHRHCSGGLSRRWTLDVKFASGLLRWGSGPGTSSLFYVTLSEQKAGGDFQVTAKLAVSELCPELSGGSQPKDLKLKVTYGSIKL